MSETQSRTTVAVTPTRLTRPIFVAALLGGLLGGAVSFAANRFIKPASPPPAPTEKELATQEAREIVERFLAMLKPDKEKKDEFMKQVKTGYTYMPDKDFELIKQRFDNFRLETPNKFGAPLYEFELLRETALKPDLIQFVYLEKFERGPIVWRFILYRGKESWKLTYLNWFDDAVAGFVP